MRGPGCAMGVRTRLGVSWRVRVASRRLERGAWSTRAVGKPGGVGGREEADGGALQHDVDASGGLGHAQRESSARHMRAPHANWCKR